MTTPADAPHPLTPLDPADADAAWVRATLGPADPARGQRFEAPDFPGPFASSASSLAAPLGRPPARRRVWVAVAAAGVAASLIAALVGAAVVGGRNRAQHVAVADNPAAVLSALGTTVAARSAQMRLTVSGPGTTVAATGAGDLASGDADFTVTLPDPIGPVEIREIGTTAYVQLPPGFSVFAGGKSWLQVDRSALAGIGGNGAANQVLGNAFDFTSVLAWLRGVGQVSSTGPGTSHGDPTATYHAVIDLAKVAGQVQGPGGSTLGGLAGLAGLAGQSVPVDLALDASGRLRRLQTSFDLSKVQAPAGHALPSQVEGVVSVSLELWGFGSPVNVAAPPPDQVTRSGSLPFGRRG